MIFRHIIHAGMLILGQWTYPFPGPGRQAASGGVNTHVHVQSCGAQVSGSVSSVSCTFSANITAGHFLWLCLANASGAMGTPVFTGDSGTFTADMALNTYVGNTYAGCYHVSSAGGGGATITATASGLDWTGITIDEFSGVGALDVNDTPATGVSSSYPSSNSVTPTAGDLVLGYSAQAAGYSPTYIAGTGFTLGAIGTYPSANEYMLSSSGSVSATFGLSGSGGGTWLAHVVAFK